jgi:hypothetical protein
VDTWCAHMHYQYRNRVTTLLLMARNIRLLGSYLTKKTLNICPSYSRKTTKYFCKKATYVRKLPSATSLRALSSFVSYTKSVPSTCGIYSQEKCESLSFCRNFFSCLIHNTKRHYFTTEYLDQRLSPSRYTCPFSIRLLSSR